MSDHFIAIFVLCLAVLSAGVLLNILNQGRRLTFLEVYQVIKFGLKFYSPELSAQV